MDKFKIIYGLDDSVPLPRLMLLILEHLVIIATSLLFPSLIISVGLADSPFKDILALTQISILSMALATACMYLRSRYFGCGYLSPMVIEPSFIGIAILSLKAGGYPLLFGISIISSLFQVIFGFTIHFIKRWIPKEVVGLIVTMIGISLIKPVITSAFDHQHHTSFLWRTHDVILFLITLFLTIGLGLDFGESSVKFRS